MHFTDQGRHPELAGAAWDWEHQVASAGGVATRARGTEGIRTASGEWRVSVATLPLLHPPQPPALALPNPPQVREDERQGISHGHPHNEGSGAPQAAAEEAKAAKGRGGRKGNSSKAHAEELRWGGRRTGAAAGRWDSALSAGRQDSEAGLHGVLPSALSALPALPALPAHLPAVPSACAAQHRGEVGCVPRRPRSAALLPCAVPGQLQACCSGATCVPAALPPPLRLAHARTPQRAATSTPCPSSCKPAPRSRPRTRTPRRCGAAAGSMRWGRDTTGGQLACL